MKFDKFTVDDYQRDVAKRLTCLTAMFDFVLLMPFVTLDMAYDRLVVKL